MSAWTCRQLSARPPLRSFHLVFEPHDGRALAPIPKRSTSPRVTSAPPVVDSLKALDPNRPIREAGRSTAANLSLFDHLVSAAKQGKRYGKAECLSGYQIDDQVFFSDLFTWKISRLLPLENPAD